MLIGNPEILFLGGNANSNPPSSKITSGLRINYFESSLAGKIFEVLERAGCKSNLCIRRISRNPLAAKRKKKERKDHILRVLVESTLPTGCLSKRKLSSNAWKHSIWNRHKVHTVFSLSEGHPGGD